MTKSIALDIHKFLPHRAPFLMVDTLLSLDDEHVTASFLIKPDCIFINDGVFNEVGLIENAAQTCSSIVGKSYFEDADPTGERVRLLGFISAIKKVEILDFPEVGQTIISHAKLLSRFDSNGFSICTLHCNISTGDKELLSCEMNLFIQEVTEIL